VLKGGSHTGLLRYCCCSTCLTHHNNNRMMSVAKILLVALFLGVTNGHDWGWGICPRVDPVQNLSVDKFLGTWYVIQQFDTSSSCLTLNYTRVSDTQLKVTKARQFYLLDAVGMEHTNAYTGTLDIPDGDNQGKMRVKWPLNFAGKGDYVVFDTDYTGYAGIYECQRITSLMHRQSATILSRTPYLNVTFIDRIKRRLRSFDIEEHDFDQVVHDSCISRSESDLNINVDEDTFKKVVAGTVEGVKTFANTVADGVRGVANAVGAGANSIMAGQTMGDQEVIVVNNDDNVFSNVVNNVHANPDAEFI